MIATKTWSTGGTDEVRDDDGQEAQEAVADEQADEVGEQNAFSGHRDEARLEESGSTSILEAEIERLRGQLRYSRLTVSLLTAVRENQNASHRR